MTTQINIQGLISTFELEKKVAETTLDNFKSSFDKSPKNALEWADNTFKAAATIDNANEVLKTLQFVEKTGDEFTHKIARSVINRLDQHFVRMIQKASTAGQTGGSARLMELAQTEVSTSWFDDRTASAFSREVVVKVIQSAVKS